MPFSAVQLADAFDRIDDENRRKNEAWLRNEVLDAATEYGVDDWRTSGVAIGAGLAEAGWNFFAMNGRALVDVLRLGETIRSPGAGAALRDGLRILQVVPFLGAATKLARLDYARMAAAGSPTSCAVTSNTVATRLSGTRLTATMQEVWNAALLTDGPGSGLGQARWFDNPLTPGFPGISAFDGMVPAIEALGARVPVRVPGSASTLDDVVALVNQRRGPVVFSFEWMRGGVSGGGHQMAAYRNVLGRIVVADQTGEHLLRDFLAMVAQRGDSFVMRGHFLVEYARWVNRVELATRMGTLTTQAGQVIPDLPPVRSGAAWIARHLELPLYHLPGPIAVRLDSELRTKLNRPPRKPMPKTQPNPPRRKPAHRPSLWDDPNLDGAGAGTRTLWGIIRSFGGQGTRTPVGAIFAKANMSQAAFDMGLMELEVIYQRIHQYQDRFNPESVPVVLNVYAH